MILKKILKNCKLTIITFASFFRFFINWLLKVLSTLEKLQIPFGYGSKQPFSYLYLRLNKVVFGKYFFVRSLPYLFMRGNIRFGHYCSIGEFTRFWNFGSITIGDDFMAAAGLTILTGGHDPDTLEPFVKSVVIGNKVWCGANVTILPGVTIGDNVVIGAGSLVTKNLKSNSIYAGVPARYIRDIDVSKRQTVNWSMRKLINNKKNAIK